MSGAPSTRRPAFFWMILALGAVVLAAEPLVVHVLLAHGGPLLYRGWRSRENGSGQRITYVDPQGPAAAALVAGDSILAVNGDSRVVPDVLGHFQGLRPDDPYTLRVDREALQPLVVPLRLGTRPDPWQPLMKAQFVVLSLGYLVAGLIIGLLRPGERAVRIFAVTCLLAAASFLVAPLTVPAFAPYRLPWLEALLVTLLGLPYPLLPALIVTSYLRFPPGVAPWMAGRVVAHILSAWGLLLFVANTVSVILDLRGGEAWIAFSTGRPWAWRTMSAINLTLFPYLVVSIAGLLAVLFRNYRVVRDGDQRRRIQWFVWGQVVATLPMGVSFVFLAAQVIRGGAVGMSAETSRFYAIANLVSLLSPGTFVYALLKHDLLDIRIALRRGLQYLLAAGLLRVLVFSPLAVMAVGVLMNPDRTIRDMLFGQPVFLALAVAGAVGLRYRQRLSLWLDRRFFREAYDSQQILLGLVDEVRGLDSLAEVARLVCARVDTALHPEGVKLLWRDTQASGASDVTGTVSDVSALVRLLEGSGEARVLSAAEAAEAATLAGPGVMPCLAVPIGGGDRKLRGFLLLGAKKSEAAYSAEDRRLLAALAVQVAIVHENASLKRQASDDARTRQDVLAHLASSGVNLLKECPACGTCYDRDREACTTDGTALRLTLPVDRTIDAKYRLERLLGRGGMGAVYEATDLRLGRRVAVKVMTGASFGNPDALRRFEREARACARLVHPNVITVFDYGQVGADGAYLVMERLTGTTLRAALADSLAPAAIATLFDEMLDGVQSAHAAGIVHRDLKPENVFLADDGKGGRVVKVLDFGLAKLALDGQESSSLTAAGSVMGTLAYMSPEQLKGQTVDERTDLFAIGVMAMEAATGIHPFRAADTAQTVAAILGKEVRLAGDSVEVVALGDVLARFLSKDRGDRFASVAEARAALVPALRACPPLRSSRAGAGNDDATMERPVG